MRHTSIRHIHARNVYAPKCPWDGTLSGTAGHQRPQTPNPKPEKRPMHPQNRRKSGPSRLAAT
eukprot:CAMPEP_0180130580 /NCGR_PEP_ID=MMETSP0986-20121125/7944_1 /TAXON_ID=697907 /ORGANISM="non described non described, Strain CCMP2293" /LENGTH=62 /DNA_ID=CAMNT_0022070363 /DNA_START=29 /DNA_END=217 /DNA_ORIENTATION=-